MADWRLEDVSGKLYQASFSPVTSSDIRNMRWERRIKWSRELKFAKNDGRQVYKLSDSSSVIHGGISMSDEYDHVYIHLIESAPHNRSDPRRFINVARLLIAFAGQRSIDINADGFISLEPKTGLIRYYMDRYQAFPVIGRKFGITGDITKELIRVYYI